MDAGPSSVGERLERHLALIGHAPAPESVDTLESVAIIQSLVTRPERGTHRLSRATLLAPLRGKRRRQIVL